MIWETRRFNRFVERLSEVFTIPPLSNRGFALVSIAFLLLGARALWELTINPVPLGIDFVELVILASVIILWFLGHEITHGVIARRCGIGVRGIGIKLATASRLTLFPYCRLEEKDVVFDKPGHVKTLLAGPGFDLVMLGIVSILVLKVPEVGSTILPHLLLFGAVMVVINTSVISSSDLRHAILLLEKEAIVSSHNASLLKGVAITFNMFLALFFTITLCMLVLSNM